jgi:DNA-binding transcriptional LysR family regulator
MKPFEPPIPSLKLLVSIADEGSLVIAARRLGLSSSAASHAITTLERNLGGVSLVTRGPHGLVLTGAGTRILSRCRDILDAVVDIESAILCAQTPVGRSLRIAAVPSVAGTILPTCIRRFMTAFPEAEISIVEGTDDEVIQWIEDGTAHIGYVGQRPGNSLVAHDVLRDEWLAILPKTLRLSSTTVNLDFFAKHRVLLLGGGCERPVRALFESAGLTLSPVSAIKDVTTLHAMVAAGLGVSIIPQLAFRRGFSSVRVASLSPRRFRTISAIHRAQIGQVPILTAWNEIAEKMLPLVEVFEAVMPGPPAAMRQMLGFPAGAVQGKIFMRLHQDDFILRLSEESRAELLAIKGARAFEPVPGRAVREWVVVPLSIIQDRDKLRGWVRKSLIYAQSLKAKDKQPRNPKKRKRKI